MAANTRVSACRAPWQSWRRLLTLQSSLTPLTRSHHRFRCSPPLSSALAGATRAMRTAPPPRSENSPQPQPSAAAPEADNFPVAEPAECRGDGWSSTPKLAACLLQPPPNPWKSSALGLSGILCLGGGIGLLTWQHYGWLLPLIPDLAGSAGVITGAALLSAARASSGRGGDGRSAELSTSSSDEGAESRGKIKVVSEGVTLEASLLFSPDASASEAAAATRRGLGSLETVLTDAEKKHETQLSQRQQDEAKALQTKAGRQLEGGEAPRRVRQQLEPRVWVIDFDVRPPASTPARAAGPPSGRQLLDTLRAQARVKGLASLHLPPTGEVNTLLDLASPFDEVVVRITSPGGSVTDYGLAAANLARLKAAGLRTTACIDLVAASGGYMLASAASTIVAAPFAYVGSIGVVAGAPNVHKLLERTGVEYLERTAGKHKRSINVLTPNTDEGVAKFEKEIEQVHVAFKDLLVSHRPALMEHIDLVSTGEAWLALQAVDKGLVDHLCTSDRYLRARRETAEVWLLQPQLRRRTGLLQALERVAEATQRMAERAHLLLHNVSAWAPWLKWGDEGISAGGPLRAEDGVSSELGRPVARAHQGALHRNLATSCGAGHA